ncbi:MAG: NADH-quinone oxidoreductase subunit NuoG [Ilumatobacteraceae bacterium]
MSDGTEATPGVADDETTTPDLTDAEGHDSSADPEVQPTDDGADVPTDPEPEPDPNAVAITLNGRSIVARKGELIIAAADRHGEYIPRFCYHPRMSSVGMCRQCMVEVDTGRGPMLQPSCMITVAPDMVVDTDSPTAKRAQEGMIELLLANHPLDCPVCDKGGECPLQDQAFSHGPGESRYVEQKRHYAKPIPISENVLLDRERCILCDRCTRFADEVAGDKLIHFIDRGNATQVNTFPDEPFSSYFSGNTVQICPVGALTAMPYRFKARPWDLEQVDSTCTTCSVGCRISVHSSRDELLRFQGVDIDSVNWGWMCDRGRFNFEAIESELRIADPMVRGEAGLTATTWSSAIEIASQLVRTAIDENGPASIGLIGGARGTNEDAFAWARLADALGIDRRDAQIGDGLPAAVLGLPRATITEAANAPTVFLVGPDLKEELPILYLRLRDAAEQGRTKIIEFSTQTTGMSRYAWRSVRHAPGAAPAEIAKFLNGADDEVTSQIGSGDVVIVAGRDNLAVSEATAMSGVQALLDRFPAATVLPALRRGNVVGALQLGLAPQTPDHGAIATLQAAADGKLDVLVLLGADPINDCPDADLARRAIAGARRIISIDTFRSESTQQADVVLPAAAFGEQTGTTTNLEGRVSRVNQKVTARGTARPDWMIAADLAAHLGHDLGFGSHADVTAAIAAEVPAYSSATAAAIDADPDGVLAVGFDGELPAPESYEAAPSSYDYRLAVSRTLFDRAVQTSMSPSLAMLPIGAGAHIHPLDLDRIGEPDGAEVQLVSVNGSVVIPLVSDDRVQRGTIWAPFNQAGADVTEIVDATAPVTDVRIERIV